MPCTSLGNKQWSPKAAEPFMAAGTGQAASEFVILHTCKRQARGVVSFLYFQAPREQTQQTHVLQFQNHSTSYIMHVIKKAKYVNKNTFINTSYAVMCLFWFLSCFFIFLKLGFQELFALLNFCLLGLCYLISLSVFKRTVNASTWISKLSWKKKHTMSFLN